MEVLSTGYDAKAKTITFEMEDYADYAVVYQETDKSDNNNGGNAQESETDADNQNDNKDNDKNNNKNNNKNKNNNNNNGNNNQNNTQNTNGNGSQKSGITKAAGTSATAAGSTVKAVNTAGQYECCWEYHSISWSMDDSVWNMDQKKNNKISLITKKGILPVAGFLFCVPCSAHH